MRLPINVEIDPDDVAIDGARDSGPQLLVTAKDAGRILGVSRSTVYELLYAERLPSVKIGNCRRIRRSDLEAFVRDLVDMA
jgi:excisionase family DNA binding protein